MVQIFKALIFVAICLVLSGVANAQSRNNSINLEFNRSPASAIGMLEQRGFTKVKVLKRSLFALNIEACREGVKYNFKLRLDGQIYDEKRIASCTKQLTEIEVTKIAKDTGFKQINVTQVANGFRVTGCRPSNNRREQFTINRAGKVIDNRVLGVCKERLTFDRIAEELKQQGFSRINLVSDEGNTYLIRACQGNEKIEFKVRLNGRVASNNVIGNCRRLIRVADIVPLVKKQGFDRIVVKDKDLPRYLVEACRDERRYEITMNRYGEFNNPLVIGRCRPSANRASLSDRLIKEGLYRVDISKGRRARFLATACYAKRKYEIDFSAYGDLLDEREVGKCSAMSADEMKATAKSRGARKLATQINACVEGREVHYQLDRDGVFVARPQNGTRC